MPTLNFLPVWFALSLLRFRLRLKARSEERFSRNAETDLVCRLLLEKKNGVGDGTDSMGYETPQGAWHTVVPGAGGGAFLEIKEGPYDPATAAEFAPWAPVEGHASVPKFLEWLRGAQPGDTPPA